MFLCGYVCLYVCMYEAANSVAGEVVRFEQMFINLEKVHLRCTD